MAHPIEDPPHPQSASVVGTARTFVSDLGNHLDATVNLAGWARVLRATKSTTFIVLQDTSGTVQLVGAPSVAAQVHREDAVRVLGRVRHDARAPCGYEVDVLSIEVVGAAEGQAPFETARDPEKTGVGQDILIEYRPLALRTDRIGTIFRLQATLVDAFREALRRRRFTEIFSSKIVSGGTEGGANLFALQYFDRVAYLAQSPQLYKEQSVLGLERVFETGHVYRAEPHASSRHLTEYYSLDLELGFIQGPMDLVQLERELLCEMFERVRRDFERSLPLFDAYLPSLEHAPVWTFEECLDRLQRSHGRTDLLDDLDPDAERKLCTMADRETGVAAVFVLGFPMTQRPFYTQAGSDGRHAAGFDLLFRGVEITTGGQRLHRRSDLETSLRARGFDLQAFEGHLRMFDFGMPPHGGLAIGAERLTSQILGLSNVREATLYPRDRNRVAP
jgi:nondiscriminating aspartyl-tRNA synthetase